MKFYIVTMGCKINQYESQALKEQWEKSGLSEEKQVENADFILVNSCAVTSETVTELHALVRRIHKKNARANIYVTGCAAELFAEELKDLTGVESVIAQSNKEQLLALSEQNISSFKHALLREEDKKIGTDLHFPLFQLSDYNRTRAVVKIQDGCSHFCTYCIVPYTRGASVSRQESDILKEIERLIDAGFHEIILSGINLRLFGKDFAEKRNFWNLLESIEEKFSSKKNQIRFRISSLDPSQLGEEALKFFSQSTLFVPHLHISLQSGDEFILNRMGRGHYSLKSVDDFLKSLSNIWSLYALGADFITGFSGESEESFLKTKTYIENLPLTYGHIFPYSERPQTKAAEYTEQLPVVVRKERAKILRAIIEKKQQEFLKKLTKQEQLAVLIQNTEGKGVSEYYTTCIVSGNHRPKELIFAKPQRVEENKIICEPSR